MGKSWFLKTPWGRNLGVKSVCTSTSLSFCSREEDSSSTCPSSSPTLSVRVFFSPLSSVMRASLERSSLVSSSINLNTDKVSQRGREEDLVYLKAMSRFLSVFLHLSLVVLEGDRMLGGLSSSGMSSMGASRERREAWECDPASEAIRSASLRASWASWK